LKIKLTTKDLAAIAVCSALYAALGLVFKYLIPVNFYGIAFLPAVVIPAVFAVLYGPWVGGISGAIGIFLFDMLGHGIPALSLVAGVPPNFILFFLIGYLYTKNISLKQVLTYVSLAIVGLSISSILLLSDIAAFVSLSNKVALFAFTLTVIVSFVAIAAVSIRWKEWRSFAIGAVAGQITGGLLLSVTVWAVSPLFLDYFGVPFDVIYVMPFFVWTVATEIPFILLLGPPIIKAVQMAFPSLRYRNKPSGNGEAIAQKSC
jgi:uncharacterized membrane protein